MIFTFNNTSDETTQVLYKFIHLNGLCPCVMGLCSKVCRKRTADQFDIDGHHMHGL